jgi:hypothetical protein
MRRIVALALVGLVLIVCQAAAAANEDDAKKAAVALVYENIHAQYGKVWATLHPRYQRVTTRAFWESCKRKEAQKRAGIGWYSVRAIDAYPDRMKLPLLGTVRVTAVTLLARITDRTGVTGTIIDTHLWVKVGSHWKGLWTPEQYRAYKAHRCPP